ncbi:hypothetical protein [Roseovarius sp. D22-M7]|uniref:hypothetical protein n=1 Tax=Roseovarius sp. D22-M7 TaxID=3127116 RepID=UPI00300FEDF1
MSAWPDDPAMIGSGHLWSGRVHERLHISKRQYARPVREWVSSTGLEPGSYGTRSMRRTKVAQIYRKTGNLRAVQPLRGHIKMDSSVLCLGVELEGALAISEAVEIRPAGPSGKNGPKPPLPAVTSVAQHRHQTCHACIMQHFRGSGHQAGIFLQDAPTGALSSGH